MRRMLTDKLTKSIKEVVNAYNEGEFSAVTANPATTTETLTAIEINGTGYAVGGGSSSVDIDNKTIIKNQNDELETAVGGYKEVTPGSTETVTGFTYSGQDFDNTDAAEANALYDKMKNFNTLAITFTCSDGTNTYTPTFNFNGVVINEYKWNVNNASAWDSDNTFHAEFYVNISNGSEKIHIYFYTSPATITEVSEVSIEIPTLTEYHQIDINYVYDTYLLTTTSMNLTNDEAEALKARFGNLRFKLDNKYYYLSKITETSTWSDYQFINSADYISFDINTARYNLNSITIHIENNNNYLFYGGRWNRLVDGDNSSITYSSVNGKEVLGTVIGGGYSLDNINVSISDFTASGSNYTCSNTIFTTALLQTIAYLNVNNGWSSGYFNFINSSDNQVNKLIEWAMTPQTGYLEFTINNSEISTFRVTDSFNPILLTDPATIEYSADFYNFLNTNSIVKYKNETPQGAKVIETVDPQFLPGFNVVPTVAGTYTLQVTVDAQGNPTFSWVAANV